MRMLSRVLAFGGVVATLALCAFIDPAEMGPPGAVSPSQLGGGDTGLRLSAVMQYDGYEGGEPTVIASSHGLPYDHLMSGSYRYVPAAYAVHVGQSAIAWTKFDFFDGAASSHYANASLTAFGLYDGDSLQVLTTITVPTDSSSIIDTKVTTYLIDRRRWDGYKYRLVITADDGHLGNLAWSQAADSLGLPYTVHPSLAPTGGIGSAGFLTSANLVTVASRGVEVGYTGNHHRAYGALAFAKTSGLAPDSIAAYVNPSEIEALVGSQVRSYAIDLHYFNWIAAAKLDSLGYTSARGGHWNGNAGIRGYSATAPGNSRWDPARPLNWNDDSSVFGFASWTGENEADPVNSLFDYGAGSSDLDSIAARLHRFCNQSDINGCAPIVIYIHSYYVTREDIENLYEIALDRGDIGFSSQSDMIEWYKSKHVPKDAPGWAPYAQLQGITAEDSIFWGMPDPVAVATDSMVFSNNTTAINVASYPHSYTDGMTYGMMRYDAQNAASPTGTSTALNRIGTLPLSTSNESVAWLSFNVDELDGVDPDKIVEARLYWYHSFGGLGEDWSILQGEEDNYLAIVGVTNPVIFEACDESDSSYLYSDTSEETEWTIAFSAFDENTDFGDFIVARSAYLGSSSGSFRHEDVTKYIRKVVDKNLYSACFMLSGRYDGARYTEASLHNVTAARRPYLIVKVAP